MDTVKRMWAAYCEAAGGVTYDGKPLPTWEELGGDRQKCWMAAGKEAADEIERLRKNAKRDAKYMLTIWHMRQNRGNEFMEAFDQAVKLYEDEQPAKAKGDE